MRKIVSIVLTVIFVVVSITGIQLLLEHAIWAESLHELGSNQQSRHNNRHEQSTRCEQSVYWSVHAQYCNGSWQIRHNSKLCCSWPNTDRMDWRWTWRNLQTNHTTRQVDTTARNCWHNHVSCKRTCRDAYWASHKNIRRSFSVNK